MRKVSSIAAAVLMFAIGEQSLAMTCQDLFTENVILGSHQAKLFSDSRPNFSNIPTVSSKGKLGPVSMRTSTLMAYGENLVLKATVGLVQLEIPAINLVSAGQHEFGYNPYHAVHDGKIWSAGGVRDGSRDSLSIIPQNDVGAKDIEFVTANGRPVYILAAEPIGKSRAFVRGHAEGEDVVLVADVSTGKVLSKITIEIAGIEQAIALPGKDRSLTVVKAKGQPVVYQVEIKSLESSIRESDLKNPIMLGTEKARYVRGDRNVIVVQDGNSIDSYSHEGKLLTTLTAPSNRTVRDFVSDKKQHYVLSETENGATALSIYERETGRHILMISAGIPSGHLAVSPQGQLVINNIVFGPLNGRELAKKINESQNALR